MDGPIVLVYQLIGTFFEKSDNLYVVHFNGHWSDLGSWESSLEEQYPDQNNLVVSENVSAIECENSLLRLKIINFI